MRLSSLAAAALLSSMFVHGHLGHDIKREIEDRGAKLQQISRRDLSHCSAKLKARGFEQRIIERRSEILRSEREKRGLPTDLTLIKARDLILDARDAVSALNTSHLSNITHHPYDPLDTIFAGNKSCILVPEVTEGPYYVSGEFIRSDVREAYHQQGVDLLLDIQVIDVSTCEPVPNLMIDLWYANSTGVYSGVVVAGNGDSSDATNINATHGRGLQQTDREGVAQWTTFYPGHYAGRTQHIHVATHFNGTILPNHTFAGSTFSHIGQVFFDTSLSNEVEATKYYVNNTQALTTNAEDGIFLQEAAIGDPIVEYSLLGKTIDDGIFAWIAFGIDVSREGSISAAASYGEDGGHANANSGFPGGPGGPGGNFTGNFTGSPSGFPSGALTGPAPTAT